MGPARETVSIPVGMGGPQCVVVVDKVEAELELEVEFGLVLVARPAVCLVVEVEVDPCLP